MEDLIERARAIEIIHELQDSQSFDQTADMAYDLVDWVISEIPSAQPEMIREIRKWINSGNRGNADYFIVEKIEEIINKYE